MEKATIEVTGGFSHRRPALEVVREIIDERTATRNYHHRLMDYNNDRTTHLSDVQSFFKKPWHEWGTRIGYKRTDSSVPLAMELSAGDRGPCDP